MYEFTCPYCKCDFSFISSGKKGSHIGNCKLNPNKQLSIITSAKKRSETKLAKRKIKEEKYELTPSLCFYCQKKLSYKDKKKKYCNCSCAAKVNNHQKKGQKRQFSKQAIENIGYAVRKRHNLLDGKPIYRCIICSELTRNKRKYCSDKCRIPSMKRIASERMRERFRINPELHPNRLCAGKVSYPERMVKKYFIELGLIENENFIHQFKVNSYWTDFYFPDLNLCLEVDGKRWHQDKEREKKRENIIKEKHNILRFDASRIVKKEYEKEIIELVSKVLKR